MNSEICSASELERIADSAGVTCARNLVFEIEKKYDPKEVE